jgi:hypothetical protein
MGFFYFTTLGDIPHHADPADKAQMVQHPHTFSCYFNDTTVHNGSSSHSATATCNIHVEPLTMPKSTRDLFQTVRIYE